MKSCCVVIPVYKPTPTEIEQMSFARCLQVLGHYDISLVLPGSFDASWYYKFAMDYCKKLICRPFEKSFFQSIEGYNHLMMHKDFYETFLEYEYILIYQLDAWVFRDELMEWCSKGYDYIGAPWMKMEWGHYDFTAVGNGGFSLRKVRACYDILDNEKTIISFGKMVRGIKRRTNNLFITYMKSIAFYLIGRGTLEYWIRSYGRQEDAFWTIYLDKIDYGLKRPSPQEAMKFAFEVCPHILYEWNDKQLPFGCHAWQKQEPSFWKKYIS